MRQQDVFKKVGNILQELTEQYEYLKEQSDNINDLELELFAANAHFLTDHLEILRKLNTHVTKSLPPHQEAAPPFRPQAIEAPKPSAVEPPADYFPEVSDELDPELFKKNDEVEATPIIPEYTTPVAPDVTILPGVYHFEPPVKEAEPAEEDIYLAEEEPNAYQPDVTEGYQQEDEQHLTIEQPMTSGPVTGTAIGHFHVEEPVAEEPAEQQEQPAAQGFVFDMTAAQQPAEPEQSFIEPVYPHEEEPAIFEEAPAEEPQHFDTLEEPGHIAPQQPAYSPEEPEQPVASIDLGSSGDNDHFSFIRSAEPETPHQELEVHETDAYESPKEESPAPFTEQPKAAEPQPAFDYPKTSFGVHTDESAGKINEPEKPMTLNERLSAQMANNSANAAAPSHQPIKDLKSAITLNDKMLFVRDLFNGYSLAYSEAIEILNRFNNFEDANRFLTTNYVAKNNWADKQSTADKFYDFLKRRFAN